MSNNTNTLNGALEQLGETLADNLVLMGVTDANKTDGLTTLANKILTIPPSLTGIHLTTNLSCSFDEEAIAIDESVDLTGVLSASYDDTSQADVDLTGTLSGATIKIYNGQTLLGTSTTNTNGFYTYTFSPTTNGSINLHTVFDGTDDYSSCTSNNASITVEDYLVRGFANVGSWVAFAGRNNTYTSNTATTMTQINGSKGGVHSSNTIFECSGDYDVSFQIHEDTVWLQGMRIGLHSANCPDAHEQGVYSISLDTGKITFDYSETDVTTVTKYTTTYTELDTGTVVKFKVRGTTLSLYFDDTLIKEVTLSWLNDPIWLYGQSWSTGAGKFVITDFKVKEITQ